MEYKYKYSYYDRGPNTNEVFTIGADNDEFLKAIFIAQELDANPEYDNLGEMLLDQWDMTEADLTTEWLEDEYSMRDVSGEDFLMSVIDEFGETVFDMGLEDEVSEEITSASELFVALDDEDEFRSIMVDVCMNNDDLFDEKFYGDTEAISEFVFEASVEELDDLVEEFELDISSIYNEG